MTAHAVFPRVPPAASDERAKEAGSGPSRSFVLSLWQKGSLDLTDTALEAEGSRQGCDQTATVGAFVQYKERLRSCRAKGPLAQMASWTPETWKAKADAQAIAYEDSDALAATCTRLRELPPLVTSWEIERLKRLLAEAQRGERFLVQGGDCAETLADCRSPVIADKLKILLQMSLVMIHEGKRPVIRVGRFAGQYAKPRSSAVESREGVVRPSYFGDMVNRADFTEEGRISH